MKILFVCLGNICRSPMAEFILKNECKKNNIDNIFIDSKATCDAEHGKDMYPNAKDILDKYKVPYTKRHASMLSKDDYDKYDLIIGMDDSNIYDILDIIEDDYDKKVHKLLEYVDDSSNVADPWYTRDFEKAYDDINRGIEGLINYLKK